MSDLRELDLRQPDLAVALGEALDDCARDIMLRSIKGLTLDNCLYTTRVVVEVAKHYGLRDIQPVPVRVLIGNAAFAQLVQELGHVPLTDAEHAEAKTRGAAVLACGFSKSLDPNAYAGGHIVAVGGDRLFDLSADQFWRPGLGIDLGNVFAPVAQGFVEGSEALLVNSGGGVLIYDRNDDDTWATSPDWASVSAYRDVIDAIIAEIDAIPSSA